MKITTITLAVALWATTAFGYEREFTPNEGFLTGCERGGFAGSFLFQRNGRVGTLKFPQTGAAFVLFQVNANDIYRWSVTNENDRLDMDFERGSLNYRNGSSDSGYVCEGSFQPKN